MPCVQSKPVEFCAESQDDEPCKGSVLRWLFGQCVRDGTLKRLVGGAVALSVCSLCNLVTPHILGAVVDASQPNWRPSGIAKLAGVSSLRQLLFVAGCIFALGAVASAVRTEQLERAQEEVFFRLRLVIFRASINNPASFFSLYPPGVVCSLLESEARILSQLYASEGPQAVRYANSAFGGSAALLLLSPRLTATALMVLPLAGALSMLLAKRMKRLQKSQQATSAAWLSAVLDRLYAHRAVFVHQQQRQEEMRAEAGAKRALHAAAAAAKAHGLLMGSISLATNLSLLLILSAGARCVRRGQLSLGGLTSFAVYSGMVALGFSGIASLAGKWTKGRAAAEKIMEVTRPCMKRRQQQIVDGGSAANETSGTRSDTRPSQADKTLSVDGFLGEVRFEDVWFSYNMEAHAQHDTIENQVVETGSSSTAGEDERLLAGRNEADAAFASGGIFGVSFTLQPGEILALAGHSGCGKTTILRLLTKELTPQRGRILIDGVDLQSVSTSWWLKQVLGVAGDTASRLFSDLTVAENIAYGAWEERDFKRDSDEIPQSVVAAAQQASCEAFIEKLPRGYSTRVGGADSITISSGEAQRLGLARALAKEPLLLLLDEASSALDPETERQCTQSVVNALSVKATEGREGRKSKYIRSALVVAHRPSVLQACSRVVVLERGRVVQEGTYDDLTKQKGKPLHTLVCGREL